MTTLRRQLFLSLIVLLTAVGIAGGLGAYFVARQEPDAFLDNQLKQIALFVGDKVRQPPADDLPAAGIDPEDAILVQVWDARGTLVRQTNLALELPPRAHSGFSDSVAGGEPWRTYTLRASDEVIQVSQRSSVRAELAADSALRTLLPVLLLIPLSWLVVGSVIRRILGPITALAETVRRRPAGTSDPLPITRLPGEVLPVVLAVNDLLARQHDLLESRQRFISDAAHQLRTPLTALRLQARNLGHANDLDELGDMMIDIQNGIMRMVTLTDQLLQLARSDQPEALAPIVTLDLAMVLRDVVADTIPLAESRRVDLGIVRSESALFCGSAAEVRMIIGNLLDNAVRYTQPGGQVDAAIDVYGGIATISVLDDGPGIPPKDLPRIFDRFFRSSVNGGDGSGLGLSIAQAMANRCGANIVLTNRGDRPGAMAEIRFPHRKDEANAA